MASITIRNLDDEVAARLRARAAGSGRSVEEEARLILTRAIQQVPAPTKGLGTALHELFRPCGDTSLELPLREPMRKPLQFG